MKHSCIIQSTMKILSGNSKKNHACKFNSSNKPSASLQKLEIEIVFFPWCCCVVGKTNQSFWLAVGITSDITQCLNTSIITHAYNTRHVHVIHTMYSQGKWKCVGIQFSSDGLFWSTNNKKKIVQTIKQFIVQTTT